MTHLDEHPVDDVLHHFAPSSDWRPLRPDMFADCQGGQAAGPAPYFTQFNIARAVCQQRE